MRRLLAAGSLAILLTSCGSSAEDCEKDPQCAYEACLKAKELMQRQRPAVGDRMQCLAPLR